MNTSTAKTEPDERASRLLMRFLVGSAILGTEELVARLRGWQRQAAVQAGPVSDDLAMEEADPTDLARYFILGCVVWGGRRTADAVGKVFRLPLDISDAMLGALDRLPGSSLLLPLRQALDAKITQAKDDVDLRIREGWREEQISRSLARLALSHLEDESLEHVSENPQLALLIRSQLGEQSVGLATVVVDNGRAMGEKADDALETVARRLFRRGPRSTLPPASQSEQANPGLTEPSEDAEQIGQANPGLTGPSEDVERGGNGHE